MNSSARHNVGPSCELKANIDCLRQISFFAGLPLEAIKVFAYLCTREKFKAGEYLFQQGDDDPQAYFIVDGRALLVHRGTGGDRNIREYGPGEFLGGLSLLGHTHRLFSLKAAKDTQCLILNREQFSLALTQFPDALPRVVSAVVESIETWEKRLLHEPGADDDKGRKPLGITLV